MSRGLRIILAALLLSLLAYWIVVGSSGNRRTETAGEATVPVDVQMSTPQQAVEAPTVAPSMPPQVTTPAAVKSETKFEPVPEAAAVVTPAVIRPPAAALAIKSVPQTAPAVVADASTAVPATKVIASNDPPRTPPTGADASKVEPHAEPPARQPEADVATAAAGSPELRKLPEDIFLRYSVQYGDEGFKFGEATYSGHMKDGRYALTSISEATGVASLLVSGKIIQGSEGRITTKGLQPDSFSTEKGQRKRPPVRFDWQQQRLMLPGGAVNLPAQTQDLLSFPFHLALRVKETDAPWVLSVSNEKNLLKYNFQVIGREMLILGKVRMETLRVQGSRSGDSSLDVWLAPERQWLPVRIRTQDQKGKAILLTLLEGGS